MDPFITLVIIVVAFFFFYLLLGKRISDLIKKQNLSEEMIEWLKATNNRIEFQNKSFNERIDNAARVISQVQKGIGEMSEIGRGIKDLQEFLKSPKIRGNMGEQILADLLSQILPKQQFHLQYGFRTGDKVDAAIMTAAGIIPIDSKFPMENFQKMVNLDDQGEVRKYKKSFESDVKRHIDDISKKYILTDEGTIDYALMYIPSESVYYEVVNNPKIFDYAGQKMVLPVSPTTFYAYLKAILMSFEGQKIEEKAKEILSMIRSVEKEYSKIESNLMILQKHLNNAFNMMGTVILSFQKLGHKISSAQKLKLTASKKAK